MTNQSAIKDVLSVSILINDEPIPYAENLFAGMAIYYGFGFSVPAAVLTLNDTKNILTGKLALTDGTKITLSFGKRDFNRKVDLEFLNKNTQPSSTGVIFKCTCLLAVPKYSFGAQSEVYNGTSVDALRELCTKAGLKFESEETTDDKMKWLGAGISRAQFAAKIAAYSYKGDQSVMAAIVDIDKTYHYVDMMKAATQEPEYTIFDGVVGESRTADNKTFLAVAYQPMAPTGLLNALANYGTASVQTRMSGDLDTYDKISAPVMEDGVAISQEKHESFKYARMNSSAYFDSGVGDIGASNGHKRYYESKYRNQRMLALFNQAVRVQLDTQVSIPVFSTVEFKAMRMLGTDLVLNQADSGVYVVGNVTLVANGPHYSELYTLYRHHVTESGNTATLGSKNQKPSSGKPEFEGARDSVAQFSDIDNTKAIASQQNTNLKAAVNNLNSNRPFLDTFNPLDTDNQSVLDTYVSDSMSKIDSLEQEFLAESGTLGLDDLRSKYGNTYDMLAAVMLEFASAKSTLEQCGKLLPLQKLALDFVRLNIGPLLRMVESRLGKIEGLSALLLAALNALVANGDINGGYLTAPSLFTNCKQFKTDHLNAAIAERFPDKCLDNYSLDRLRSPNTRLDRLRRLLNRFLRDLLCLIGT